MYFSRYRHHLASFFCFFFHESAIETLCKVNVVAIRYMAADDLRNNEKHLMDGQVVTGYS